MAKKKGRRETMMAIDALKDLFLSDLLPSDRKLVFFYQQPLTFAVRVFAAL
jgi:ribosome biogenesis protein MAK21